MGAATKEEIEQAEREAAERKRLRDQEIVALVEEASATQPTPGN